MIFPIGDDQVKGGYFPAFSYFFIFLNVVIFLFQTSMPEGELNGFVDHFGSIPVEITSGKDWYTLITSMFLHGSWMHLIGNMLFLWVFADNIESTIGNVNFLIFYLLGGLAASAGHIYFNWESPVPTIGASGAISAVMGTYFVLFPTSRVKLFFFFFFFRIPAILFLGFWIWQQWVSGAASLDGLANGELSGVAWWAHISGFVFGILAGIFYRITGKLEGVRLGNK